MDENEAIKHKKESRHEDCTPNFYDYLKEGIFYKRDKHYVVKNIDKEIERVLKKLEGLE